MNRIEALTRRLHEGGRVVIDGGTGTELERRGVPKLNNGWNCGGTLSHPGVLRQIHIDHLQAGAEIVISNTFASSRYITADAGVGDDFVAYNQRAIELAIEARSHVGADTAAVAGGLSHWSWTIEPTLDTIASSAAEQAEIMVAAGADLIMLEMMSSVAKMTTMLDAVAPAGVPVWVGVSIGDEYGTPTGDPSTVNLRDGEPLVDALRALGEYDVDVLNIMHTDVSLIDGCLDVLDAHWNGITGVYAHSGEYVDGHWVFGAAMGPERLAQHATAWNERGVQLHGGCCGTAPEHVTALKAAVH